MGRECEAEQAHEAAQKYEQFGNDAFKTAQYHIDQYNHYYEESTAVQCALMHECTQERSERDAAMLLINGVRQELHQGAGSTPAGFHGNLCNIVGTRHDPSQAPGERYKAQCDEKLIEAESLAAESVKDPTPHIP